MATVKTFAGSKVGTRDVDETVFAQRILGRTLKEALVMYEANKRQGTHSAKERSAVAGSQKKLYRQKHTGRARAGDVRSPLRRGGGTVFGPRPRDYSYQLPKKQRRVALASALFGKLVDGEVTVVDGFPASEPSTKAARAVLREIGADTGALVVTLDVDPVLVKSVRNLPHSKYIAPEGLNVYDVLKHETLVVTAPVVKAIEERLMP